MAIMPMFPLGMTLLPGAVLPLHVFEPRYRQMVIDCLAADGEPEFGQVLITHGADAGGGDERAMIGTVAQMVRVDALDEQRYALVAIGTRRIRIDEWLADDPYPRALVEEWPDEDREPEGLGTAIERVHERVRSIVGLAAQLGDVDAAAADADISSEPLVAIYNLASLAPIGPADRYRILAAPGPSQRIEVLEDVLDDVEAMLKFRLT